MVRRVACDEVTTPGRGFQETEVSGEQSCIMFLHYTMIIAGPDYWAGRYSPHDGTPTTIDLVTPAHSA